MCTKQTSTLPDCAQEQFRYWYINWRGAHIWSVICMNNQTVYIVIQFLYRPCIPNSTGQRNFKNQNLNPITELNVLENLIIILGGFPIYACFSWYIHIPTPTTTKYCQCYFVSFNGFPNFSGSTGGVKDIRRSSRAGASNASPSF